MRNDRCSRRTFLARAGLGAVGIAATERRNIVMIVIDGQRSEMMGCAGNRLLRTPSIDHLARSGARFENSFSAHSVCMPGRAAILTGRYPSIHGVWANGVALRSSERTLAQALEERGYATFAAGKLHLEPQQKEAAPHSGESGASYYRFRELHFTQNRPGPEYLSYLKASFPGAEEALRQGQPLPEDATDAYWITTQTIRFIERNSDSPAPFFAHCSFKDMIPPDHPPVAFVNRYDPAEMPPPKRKRGELDRKPPHYRQVFEYQTNIHRYPDDGRYRRMMADYYSQMSFLDSLVHRTDRPLGRADRIGLRLAQGRFACNTKTGRIVYDL